METIETSDRTLSRRTVMKAAGLSLSALPVAALLSACSGSAKPASTAGAGAKTQKLTLATSITGSSFLGVTAGIQRGIFTKHGIDLNVISVKDTSTGVAAMASGQVDVAAMLTDGAIAAVAGGSEMKIIANLLTQDQHVLCVRSGIANIADMAGKKMAVVGPNDGTNILARYIFHRAGIEDKVTYVPSGASTSQVAALIAGQVDAAGIVPPYSNKAVASGCTALVEYRKLLPGLTPQVFGAGSQAVSQKASALKAFLAAYCESTKWLVAHPTDAVSMLEDTASLTADIARESFEYAKPDYSLDGKVATKGLSTWLDLCREYGGVKKRMAVDDVYDPSFLPSAA